METNRDKIISHCRIGRENKMGNWITKTYKIEKIKPEKREIISGIFTCEKELKDSIEKTVHWMKKNNYDVSVEYKYFHDDRCMVGHIDIHGKKYFKKGRRYKIVKIVDD